MFSGIITQVGTVAENRRTRLTISVPSRFAKKLKIGTSVAVDGMCLTVVIHNKNRFTANTTPETRARTNLPHLRHGSLVNLELPVTPHTLLSGHLVQGHVDGTALLKHLSMDTSGRTLTFSMSASLAKYIVEKGSVAVNGVSLTVAKAERTHFTVVVIPHTWKQTAIKEMKVGDGANIEVDVIGKYVEKLLKKRI